MEKKPDFGETIKSDNAFSGTFSCFDIMQGSVRSFSPNNSKNNGFNVDWSSAFDSSIKPTTTSNGFSDPFATFDNKSILLAFFPSRIFVDY